MTKGANRMSTCRKRGVMEPLRPEHPDARLIAAAPALLAACEKLIEQYDAEDDYTLGGQLTCGPFLEIKEAIALAKGART